MANYKSMRILNIGTQTAQNLRFWLYFGSRHTNFRGPVLKKY